MNHVFIDFFYLLNQDNKEQSVLLIITSNNEIRLVPCENSFNKQKFLNVNFHKHSNSHQIVTQEIEYIYYKSLIDHLQQTRKHASK